MLEPQTRRAQAGDQIGRWEVVRHMGSGGWSDVYQVLDPETGEDGALKLPAADSGDTTSAARLVAEADCLARIDNRHVVRLLDQGTTDSGSPFLVMELVRGYDLELRIHEQGPLRPDAVVDLAHQTLDGLRALRDAGVVHRDLKPSNLMLSPGHDGGFEVKLLDFGIARDVTPRSIRLTGEQVVLGTPQYMAPEYCLGSEPDVRADLYALGVIMFECLTGRPPVQGDTPLEILTRRVHEDAPRVQALRPDCPALLQEIIAHALEKDPNERYLTPEEMAADLAACTRLDRLRDGVDAWWGEPTLHGPTTQPFELCRRSTPPHAKVPELEAAAPHSGPSMQRTGARIVEEATVAEPPRSFLDRRPLTACSMFLLLIGVACAAPALTLALR